MLRKIKLLVLSLTLVLGLALNAQAFNAGVVGPTSLQNGFPVWWQDDGGIRIGLCFAAACAPTPVIPGNAMSEQAGFGDEMFWWLSSALFADPAVVVFEFAMEAAWAVGPPAPGDQLPFARIRIRANTPLDGPVVITTPYGIINADAVGGVINTTIDIAGTAANVPPFSGVLATSHTNFLTLGQPVVPGAVFSGTGPIVTPGLTTTVSVVGAGLNASTANFDTAALAFNDGNNAAPIANPDVGAALVASPTILNLAANDADLIDPVLNVHGINTRAVGLGTAMPFVLEPGDPANTATPGMATAQGGRVAKNPNGTVTYLPAPAFSGVDSFSYVIQDTGGCISGQIPELDVVTGNTICQQPAPGTLFQTAQVILTVEQIQASAALRTKIQKWDVSGTSSVASLTTTDAATGETVLFTNLFGAFEVPPVDSLGDGSATFTIRGTPAAPTSIDFTLEAAGLATPIQAAHIHTGAFGVNGGVIVTLFDVGGGAFPATGVVTGTILPADVGAPFNGDLAALVAAMQAGNTYVNLHTTAVPSGEIRGQVARNGVAVHNGATAAAPVIGAAVVQSDGTFTLPEKLSGLPTAGSITLQSIGGNVLTVPVSLN